MMRFSRFGGSPNIGVYAAVNENLAIIAGNTSSEFIRDVENTLQVESIMTTMAGSFVVGSLVVMNSSGAIVSGLSDSFEIDRIKEKIPVLQLGDVHNAAGNNILANDNGAIINPELDEESEKAIADFLGVETVRANIGGYGTVGSVCTATNKGCICCSDATDDEVKFIQDILKVEVKKTSVNHGSKFVGSGVLANSKGALVGDETTPIEMGKIEEGLDLY